MSESLAVSAETKFIDAKDVRYAYREIGPKGGTPLVLCHRFRGTMDDWDPALIDALAAERHVILFDNAGVGLSSGEVPATIKGMADRAAQFITAMGFRKVDLLGFSMGGYAAQVVTLDYPELVRKLVLAGTGPGGGEGVQPAAPEVREISGRPVLGLEEFLDLFFSPSNASKGAAERYWERLHRRADREPPLPQAGIEAQVTAIRAWSQGEGSAFSRLHEIKQPVFVANGNNDVMIPTVNSFIMAQRLRDSLLIIYPDSGHGFLFQYPEQFARHTLEFLR
jgi:pimeloyl-ACP methyl ester carboxylesterase